MDGVESNQYAISDAGTLAYIPGVFAGSLEADEGRTLVWVDRNGREESIPVPPRSYSYARVSPDGTELALMVVGENAGIYTWSIGSGPLRRFPERTGVDQYPVWIDDREIAFLYTNDDSQGIYRHSLDSGVVELIADGSTMADGLDVYPISMFPEADSIAVSVLTDSFSELGLLSLDGTYEAIDQRRGQVSLNQPEISPDGTHIAHQAIPEGILVREFPDVDSTSIEIGVGVRPAWSRDGTELYFQNGVTISLWPWKPNRVLYTARPRP